MNIKDCMSTDLKVADPDRSIRDAARLMAKNDTGWLPVGEDDRLIGFITDRDIAIRAVAESLPPTTTIRDVMSKEVLYCMEDDACEDVLENMGKNQVRRLPVLNSEKRLVGIVSLSDITSNGHADEAGEALGEIARETGLHSQSLH